MYVHMYVCMYVCMNEEMHLGYYTVPQFGHLLVVYVCVRLRRGGRSVCMGMLPKCYCARIVPPLPAPGTRESNHSRKYRLQKKGKKGKNFF